MTNHLADLDHVNIRTARPEILAEFYERVLGLRRGPRPGLDHSGFWLYCGQRAAVHLSRTEGPRELGRIDHFAFRGKDRASFIRHLEAAGIHYWTMDQEPPGVRQVKINDPDGNEVEIAFPLGKD